MRGGADAQHRSVRRELVRVGDEIDENLRQPGLVTAHQRQILRQPHLHELLALHQQGFHQCVRVQDDFGQ